MYYDLGRSAPDSFIDGFGFCSRLIIGNHLLSRGLHHRLRLTINGRDCLQDFFSLPSSGPGSSSITKSLYRRLLVNHANQQATADIASRFQLAPSFLAYCEESYLALGSPRVGLQIRETDKHDEQRTGVFRVAVPTVYYRELVDRLLQQYPCCFVASDSEVTLNCLRQHFGDRVKCQEIQRASSVLPIHQMKHLSRQPDEYESIRAVLLDVYCLRRCERVYFGMMSGVVLLATLLDGVLDPYCNEKYAPAVDRQSLPPRELELLDFYEARERALWQHLGKLYHHRYRTRD